MALEFYDQEPDILYEEYKEKEDEMQKLEKIFSSNKKYQELINFFYTMKNNNESDLEEFMVYYKSMGYGFSYRKKNISKYSWKDIKSNYNIDEIIAAISFVFSDEAIYKYVIKLHEFNFKENIDRIYIILSSISNKFNFKFNSIIYDDIKLDSDILVYSDISKCDKNYDIFISKYGLTTLTPYIDINIAKLNYTIIHFNSFSKLNCEYIDGKICEYELFRYKNKICRKVKEIFNKESISYNDEFKRIYKFFRDTLLNNNNKQVKNIFLSYSFPYQKQMDVITL